jgi:hypothetical protein
LFQAFSIPAVLVRSQSKFSELIQGWGHATGSNVGNFDFDTAL